MAPKAKPKAKAKSPRSHSPSAVAKAKASPKAERSEEAKANSTEVSSDESLQARIVRAFRSFDANADGKIMRSDLVDIMRFISDGREWNEADVSTLMDQIDTSKDGLIDYEEFASWLVAGSTDAETVFDRSSDPGFMQQRLNWCMEELKLGEEAAAPPKPYQVWFNRDDHVGITFGRGAEGKANRVTRIVRDSAAHSAGVEVGWRVVSVGDACVQGTTYVPDVIMEARKIGSALVKFVSPADLEKQSLAEDKLPGLMAAVDLARLALENQGKARGAASVPEVSAQESAKEDTPHEKLVETADPSKALALYQPKTADAYLPSYHQLMIAMGCEEEEDNAFKGNPYTVLNVSFTATQEEIKTAFMTLARIYHPDKYPENPKAAKERFDKIKKAYDSLRSEEERAKIDNRMVQKGIGCDLLTLYSQDPKKAVEKMIQVPDDFKDPDADPGQNMAFQEKGVAAIHYYDYKMPFPVPDGRLSASAVDEIYGISDAMPGCDFFLAEWRPGKRHIYKHGEDDAGSSSLMEKKGDTFYGLETGMSYFLLVLEGEDESKKRSAREDLIRRQREAAELANRIVHNCQDEQIYVFGLGSVCRICSDKDHAFR